MSQLASTRAINRSKRKSGHVWEIVEVTGSTSQGRGRQDQLDTSKTEIDPIEHKLSEREAGHYGMTNIVGAVKLLIPADVELTEKHKLLCDGNEVNIIQTPDRHNEGVAEYNVVICQIRQEDTDA